MNKTLLLGGAVLGYLLFFRGKKVAPQGVRLIKVAGGTRCVDSRGTPVSMLKCTIAIDKGEVILADPSQLEGGYFSTGDVPCCRNCTDGRPCAR